MEVESRGVERLGCEDHGASYADNKAQGRKNRSLGIRQVIVFDFTITSSGSGAGTCGGSVRTWDVTLSAHEQDSW